VSGYPQVTEGDLLGLAATGSGVLVTFDKTIKYLAGAVYSQNVLVLEKEAGNRLERQA
jgi:hypothetical protein